MKSPLKTVLIALCMTLLAGCGNFEWFPDSDTTTTVNAVPVANAGSAQNVLVGDLVALNGNASSDANGDTLTYLWALASKPNGSTAALSSATVANPTFAADIAGAYTLSLTVNDGKVSSAAATVTVTAFTSPPVAHAGADQTVIAGTSVQLDGSASSGAIQSYNWSRQSPSCGILSSATVVNPVLTGSTAGTCVIALQVFDRITGSTTDTVSITVTPVNSGSLTVTW